MRLTAQEEYGLRCILKLAQGECNQQKSAEASLAAAVHQSITVSEVAESEGLSEQYAGKLFRVLSKSALVESVRGRKGGYRLTRPPREVSLAETLLALGPKIYEQDHCQRYTGHNDRCAHAGECPVRPVWKGIQKIVDHVLSGISLADLLTEPKSVAESVKNQVEAITHSRGE